ncbi:dihydrofolate reductase [Motilibacter peucedani]|uniref:Dihydrofolate reductase n=1 Tax=Motilibacter peucedani TaxID=598650 RepID=A0A420XNJ8_9ACTN|nr:dihydrofolate reductase family protein [Motilibacter peucedani]RKS73756.1 dihydrofolate reductase [Motilibacter peucedani]
MGRIISSVLVSLDGVVEAPWTWAPFDDEAKAVALGALRTYDGFVMGRESYERFSTMWGPVVGDPYIDAVNAAPKHVVSSTLDDVSWNASLVTGDPVEQVAELRASKTLVKYGTGRLDDLLLAHRLLDEVNLWVWPVVVGSGRHVFEGLSTPVPPLELTSVRELANGSVIHSYVPRYAG